MGWPKGSIITSPTSNAEEAEVERVYEDLQDLLELTPQNGHPEGDFDWGVKNTPGQEGPGISGREHS